MRTSPSSTRGESDPTSPSTVTGHGAPTLSLGRINLMRVGYLIMGVGLAATKWPSLFNRDEPWQLYEGTTTYLLVAMGLLALIGLRYPVKMLPLLVFESVWKVMWLLIVARPLWMADQMDSATSEVASACLWVVIVIAVTPWRYVLQQYLTAPGDPWHRRGGTDACAPEQ